MRDAQGFEFWVSQLESGMDFAEVLIGFATSLECQGLITGDIANGIQYDVWQ
jgi:hypothetical protein